MWPLLRAVLIAIAVFGTSSTFVSMSATTASAVDYVYDVPIIERLDGREFEAAEVSRAQPSYMREGSVSRSTEERGTSTTASATFIATNTVNLNTGNVSVYTSTKLAGDVDYVGITNNAARRGAEHLAEKGITINEIPGLTSLSRADARAVEQVLIESNGGPGGGQLLNKINSIAESNTAYGQSIQRGCQLLAAVSYSVSSSVCP
jgi:hypothetical protein